MKTTDPFFWLLIALCIAAAGCISADTTKPSAAATGVPAAGTTSPGPTGSPAAATTAPAGTAAAVIATVTTGPSAIRPEPGLATIARITGGPGVTSQNVTVPAGYWELWYSADPLATGGQDSHSATGSQSALFPSLTIQITDTRTGTVIDTVEPPGGLDRALWASSGDPRPWSVKFYGGNTEYNFLVTGRHIASFTLEVRVRA